jgi:RNA polymerase sigma-70 factor (ECF subfamily)
MSSESSSHSSNPDKPCQSDAELFTLLQMGQKNALAILYDRHAPLVYGIALKLLGNTQEAEDLTQDIFLKIKESTYDPKRGSLRTFLGILTRSRAFDLLRTRTRNQKQLRRQIANSRARVISYHPIEEVSQVERSQEVKNALAQLTSQEREVLKMAYYEGLSQSEIATQLNTPIGTVKSRARRGLLKLRQALADFAEKS